MRLPRRTFLIGPIFFACTLFAFPAATQTYDVIFRGGELLDGSGAASIRADVGVMGDRVAAIGDLSKAKARRSVDCEGLTVIPGIVDLHSHADGSGEAGGLRSRDPRRRAAPNLVTQGVTTVVVNQDGRSPTSIENQIAQIRDRGVGPNAIVMVGHNTIRRMALRDTDKDRPSTATQVDTMRQMVREGMDAGAWGLTAGLEYEPGIWSTTEEITALVQEVRPYNGVYIVHERASGIDPMWYVPSQDREYTPTTMADNIREIIHIAETTGVTSVATHIKARGVDYWGASDEMVALINAARERGVPIYADQYPYNTSGSDGTIRLLPSWIVEQYNGSKNDYRGALRAAIEDEDTARALALDVLHQIGRRGGPGNILVLEHPNPGYVGRTLADLMRELNVNPVEMAYVLQLEGYADRLGGALLRGFSMDEADVRTFAAQPWCITASDAGITLPNEGFVHARYYGTFPRKLRKYAMEEGVLSVEQAVRSMTSLPAEVLGLIGRGYLHEGCYADIAVFDLDTVRDTATFFNPHQYAEGVPYVMINGDFVVDGGHRTLRLPGRVLTPASAASPRDTDD